MNEMKKELVECIDKMTATDKIAIYNEYCKNENYYDSCFYGMEDFESYNSWDLPIDAGEVADYILSRENALGNDEIQYILGGGRRQ